MTNHLLFQAEHVTRVFRAERRRLFQPRVSVTAVSDVSLRLVSGSSLAIVGESGSGKSTLLRLLLGLDTPSSGTISFSGRPVLANPRDRMLWLRRETGLVFQDPLSSLDPKMTIGNIVAEPLQALSLPGNHRQQVREMLDRVQLPTGLEDRYPHECSGGQRQRVAIARALVHGPSVLIGDEPVSALDLTVRDHIVELLAELRRELSLTLLTVTHDLAVVPALAEELAVMHQGQIVETGTVRAVLNDPKEAYTQQLISAVPRLQS